MAKIGCKPFWLEFLKTDLPNCTEASQISRFLEGFLHLTLIDMENELMESYSCLKPCRYMEYKVKVIYRSISFTFHGFNLR